MSNRLVNPDPQFFDNSGQPLNGGVLRFYLTTTSTPVQTYSNAALTISNGSYVTLDSAGRSPVDIFLDPSVTYKVTLETSAGVVLWTRDPVVDLAANINASVQVYAGNPNTHVAGSAGTPGSSGASMVFDITNQILYICTTTGNAASAVWTAISNSFTGGEDIYATSQTLTIANAGRIATANSATAITFNLTAAATIGSSKFFSIKNIGAGVLTIDPAGAELIEGAASITLFTNQSAIIYCTGSTWRILALSLADFSAQASAGAGAGPVITYDRASASPAAADLLANIIFSGRNTTPAKISYADIIATILDATPASEDGSLLLRAMIAGGLTAIATLGPGVQIGAPSGGDKGAGTVNATSGFYENGVKIALPSTVGSQTGFLFGLTLSNNAGGTTALDIAAGSARDSTDVDTMVLAAALTAKVLGTAWSVGSSGGLLDTGAIANATYHIYLIKRPDTGVVDAIASTSASAPTLPANYTIYRRIGSVIRSGAAIVLFSQFGDEFLRLVPSRDASAVTWTTTASLIACGVPTGVKVGAIITASLSNSASGTYVLVTSPDQTDSAVTSAQFNFTVAFVTQDATFDGIIRTDTSGQVRVRASGSTTPGDLFTRGWIDTRGRLN